MRHFHYLMVFSTINAASIHICVKTKFAGVESVLSDATVQVSKSATIEAGSLDASQVTDILINTLTFYF
jgi:hypothetical protein